MDSSASQSPQCRASFPALLGLLAVLAAIHVFVTDPKRPLALLRTPIGIVLGIFIAYLFINAAWAVDPRASFAKAVGVLGLGVSVFLIADPIPYALSTTRACSPSRL